MMDIYWNCLIGKGSGGWDLQDEVQAAARRIRVARPVVFDVGANIGDWSQGLLQAVPDAKIYMFDPSPGCQAAIRQKALPNTKLFPVALGEVAETKTYYSSSETDGSASLYTRFDTSFAGLAYRQTTVEIRTLDEIIEAEKIGQVDFMKMDIEGHELFALRGAKRALAAGKIRALAFEFGGGNLNSRTFFRDFWELLTAAQFIIYRITPAGKEMLVSSYSEEDEFFQRATNFVAERKP